MPGHPSAMGPERDTRHSPSWTEAALCTAAVSVPRQAQAGDLQGTIYSDEQSDASEQVSGCSDAGVLYALAELKD